MSLLALARREQGLRAPVCRCKVARLRAPDRAFSITTRRSVKGEKASPWSSTLFLPSTKLQLRANAIEREPLFRKRTTEDLYRWQAAQHDRPSFVLHDGPPYANGPLHMGHVLNKIVKDVICRYQMLRGKRVHYRPGWDCHGLPIEAKVTNAPGKRDARTSTANPLQVRKAARQLATDAMKGQEESFQQLAIMADWSKDTTYRTYDADFVKRQLRLMREMVRRGLLYRASRPVFWSPSLKSALAESEVEYAERESLTVFVRFPLQPGPKLAKAAEGNAEAEEIVRTALQSGKGISLVVWTTTPWTLPSNMAVNINPDLVYSVVRSTRGVCKDELMIVAQSRLKTLEQLKLGLLGSADEVDGRSALGELTELFTVRGSDLCDSTYRHPYLPPSERARPIIAASYVTADSGTGLVHSAAGHGKDDYNVWQSFCRLPQNADFAREPILSPIDDESRYTQDVRQLAESVTFTTAGNQVSDGNLVGLALMSDGNKTVIESLHHAGYLLSENILTHRVLQDWRLKRPTIVRCTSQWFANLEVIRDQALAALKDVRFTPPSGRPRLERTLGERGEWCISRQRAWGVPIPVIYDVATDEALMSMANMEHIERLLAEKGVDYWWTGEAEEFVAPSERRQGVQWRKGKDIVDVWFDSGSSWTMLPGVKEKFDEADVLQVPNHPVADVYLEGTDQHRGWFQSSLLTYVALGGAADNAAGDSQVSAPFRNIITHGFVMNKRGEKLSKSNNKATIKPPSHYIGGSPGSPDPAYGVDAIRVWATQGDPQTDTILSPTVIKQASDSLTKVRNTCRFVLSVLPLPHDVPLLDEVQLGLLERYVLDATYQLDVACRAAYDEFDFAQVMRRLSDYCHALLSGYYFDVSKDTLYCDGPDSSRRRATLAVLDQVLRTMLSIVGPVAPHMVEEVWHYYNGAQSDPTTESDESTPTSPKSFFQQGWQSIAERYRDREAEEEFKSLLAFRSEMLTVMETGRQAKLLRESQGVEVDIHLSLTTSTNNGSEPALVRQRVSADRMRAVLAKYADDLAHLFLLSRVNVMANPVEADNRPEPSWTLKGAQNGIPFVLRPAVRERCPRCRYHRIEPTEDEEVCKHCRQALAAH